jgi:hypothetical protein
LFVVDRRKWVIEERAKTKCHTTSFVETDYYLWAVEGVADGRDGLLSMVMVENGRDNGDDNTDVGRAVVTAKILHF